MKTRSGIKAVMSATGVAVVWGCNHTFIMVKKHFRYASLLPALLVSFLILPTLASAQAPRTCAEVNAADKVLCMDFDDESLGDYTFNELKAKHTIIGWNSGLTGSTGGRPPQSRSTIVTGSNNAVVGNAMRSWYPSNSIGSETGTHFSAVLPGTPHKELYFGYWFRKDPTWPAGNTLKGGKLPGLAGGTDDSGDITICCGDPMLQGKGVSTRWMFTGQTNSNYIYWMDNPRGGTPVFGDSGKHRNPYVVNDSDNIGTTNAVITTPGTWYFHEQHIRLNDPGVSNGFYEAWINGMKTAERNSTRFRASGQNWSLGRLFFSTHLGGSDSSWESGQENYSYFDTLIVSKKRIWGATAPPPSPDTTPPAVSITAPANGTTVSGSAVTFSADPSDNIGVSSVAFKVDGTTLFTDTTSPYAMSWNTTSSTNGSHMLTAKASDAAGNTTTSSAVTVTVSNGSPSGTLSLNADKTPTRLTIDGILGSPWDLTTNVTKTVINTGNNIVTFDALWDNTYLYVGVKVLDGTLNNDSANMWDDDSVEIYVDSNHSHSTTYDSTDLQFAKGYNDSSLSVRGGNTTGVLHAWAATTGGYTIELAIPWTKLGITPTNNMTIGLDVGVNDDDNGTTRDSQMMWNGTNMNYKNTSAFGHSALR